MSAPVMLTALGDVWLPGMVFGVMLLSLWGILLGWTFADIIRWLTWSGLLTLSIVVVLVGVWLAVRTLDGYERPVLNTGTSLPGTLFLCKPLTAEGPLRRGEIVYYVPSEALKALIRQHVPAAELRLGWLKQVIAVAGDDVCWG